MPRQLIAGDAARIHEFSGEIAT